MTLQQYFQSYNEYFWQWEDGHKVIAIPGVLTIAYTKQVMDYLDILSMQGIPRFGPLLMAIAATNNKSEIILLAIRDKLAQHYQNEESLNDAFEFLDLLSSLPNDLKQGEKRAILFQAIFEESHNRLSIKNSEKLLRRFRVSHHLPGFFKQKKDLGIGFVHSEIKIVALLHKKFKTEADIEAAMLGFTNKFEVPVEMEELQNEGEEMDFVTQMLQNPETNKVGALIKRIWSSVNIPMHHRVSSGQPFGGVADITNKGSFDKLLTSEFANEEVAFLSRLANNEALFYNREAPPSKNNQTRVVIVDVSLKSWGNVHVISMAMLLAICNNPNTVREHVCFAVGNQFYPFEIDSLIGVLDAMQVLDTNLNANKGLELLFKEMDLSDKEVFFISLKETADHKDVKQLLSENNYPIDYWIHATSLGGIEIFKKYRNSKKLHQSLILPVEQLWSENEKKSTKYKKIVQPKNNEGGGFPILVPSPGNCNYRMFLDGEVYKINANNHLFKKVGVYRNGKTFKNYGYQVIPAVIVHRLMVFELGRNMNGELILFSFNKHFGKIIMLNIETKGRVELNFSHFDERSNPVCVFYNFSFVLIHGAEFYRITLKGDVQKIVGEKKQIQSHRIGIQKAFAAIKDISNEKIVAYKNFKKVGISNFRSLVIGAHHLNLNHNGDLRLKTKGLLVKFEATKHHESEECYTFDDGSSLYNHQCGIVVLTSSNHKIPIIYLTCAVGPNLGMATDEVFAGNEYFYRPSSKLIKKTDASNLEADIEGKLFNFEERISNSTEELISNVGPTKGLKNHQGLKKISTKEFYDKYIQAYINTIYNHYVTKIKTT